jgi:glycine/D-amino acid oxidase-like deaminating enzyme
MAENRSPWLSQLRADRPAQKLSKDSEADVAIIGAGIAGISTAFFILKHTECSATIIEQSRIGSGATGHNAGQVISDFEIGFANLVKQFGVTAAGKAQQAIEKSWQIIDEMYADAELDIPFPKFVGYSGFSSLEQTLEHLENNAARIEAGLKPEKIRIAESAPFLNSIPEKYSRLFELETQDKILRDLETKTADYWAIREKPEGLINSALFCEKIAGYLSKTFGNRFTLYEHSAVLKVVLHEDQALLDVGNHTMTANRVVLATNGYEKFEIFDRHGLTIDHKFHQLIEGTIGYMTAFTKPEEIKPGTISYFYTKHTKMLVPDDGADQSEGYFYLSHRPFNQSGVARSLTAVGGLDHHLSDSQDYESEGAFPESLAQKMEEFLWETLGFHDKGNTAEIFHWHGLMGYTHNGVRLIGVEPQNPVLIYNLGCNGIGILTSIYGGHRIAEIIGGKTLEASIFDVPERA